ncbi:MAG: toll/interleukin-1 receptor domain-containing protein [Acidobacteriia bacterium]|nr:toll/interleukin-1 receptor domain-containing protein [Terriglobia bacterium]
MDDPKQLKILKKGVEAWNQWRERNPGLQPNLLGADLSGKDLRGANFRGAILYVAGLREANLGGADLSGADLRSAGLSEANLLGADLSRADLSSADLSKANLSEADLLGADLLEATLSDANLSGAGLKWAYLDGVRLGGANLAGASLYHTTFANVDLSAVKGLESVKHEGPSIIGIDTIYRSHGRIPETFLRGTGVSDNFIEYMRSLAGKAFEFYSCFISYSSKDQEFADRLYADLQAKGVRCWFAPHDMKPGQKLHEQIDAAIRVHEKLLLVLSPQSINSDWVQTEIAKARKREKNEGPRMLFPIRLGISFRELQEWESFDADTGKDSAREIREYFIPDFSDWKDHDAYQQSFQKLLEGLQGEKAAS